MNEKEFIKKYPKEIIEIPIYFGLYDNGEIAIDEGNIREVFEGKLKNVLDDCLPIKEKIMRELE